MSRVLSVEFESTTTISSAQATDSQAALIFDSSLKVMIVAVICMKKSVFPWRQTTGNTDYILLKRVMGFELWSVGCINDHVVSPQSRRSSPLQFGERLVVVGFRTQFGGTRICQRVFTLEQKERLDRPTWYKRCSPSSCISAFVRASRAERTRWRDDSTACAELRTSTSMVCSCERVEAASCSF